MKPAPSDALLVIDMQYDFLPGGALAVTDGDKIVKPIANLMPQFGTVILSQCWHPKGHISFASSHKDKKPFDEIQIHNKPHTLWPDHCIQGTAGAQIHKDLPLDCATVILRKGTNPLIDSYSAFEENYGPGGKRNSTGLMGMLLERVVRRVIVVGLARDYCVLWSAQSIAMVIPTVVLWDLTKPVNPDNSKELELSFRRATVSIV